MRWYEYLIIGIAMLGAVHLGLLVRAEAKKPGYLEIPFPIAHTKNTTIELIATMEDGKVRVYRVIDFPFKNHVIRVCHITVGELHGKTVTMDCTQP
jgi:hypothetical protein